MRRPLNEEKIKQLLFFNDKLYDHNDDDSNNRDDVYSDRPSCTSGDSNSANNDRDEKLLLVVLDMDMLAEEVDNILGPSIQQLLAAQLL